MEGDVIEIEVVRNKYTNSAYTWVKELSVCVGDEREWQGGSGATSRRILKALFLYLPNKFCFYIFRITLNIKDYV